MIELQIVSHGDDSGHSFRTDATLKITTTDRALAEHFEVGKTSRVEFFE